MGGSGWLLLPGWGCQSKLLLCVSISSPVLLHEDKVLLCPRPWRRDVPKEGTAGPHSSPASSLPTECLPSPWGSLGAGLSSAELNANTPP